MRGRLRAISAAAVLALAAPVLIGCAQDKQSLLEYVAALRGQEAVADASVRISTPRPFAVHGLITVQLTAEIDREGFEALRQAACDTEVNAQVRILLRYPLGEEGTVSVEQRLPDRCWSEPNRLIELLPLLHEHAGALERVWWDEREEDGQWMTDAGFILTAEMREHRDGGQRRAAQIARSVFAEELFPEGISARSGFVIQADALKIEATGLDELDELTSLSLAVNNRYPVQMLHYDEDGLLLQLATASEAQLRSASAYIAQRDPEVRLRPLIGNRIELEGAPSDALLALGLRIEALRGVEGVLVAPASLTVRCDALGRFESVRALADQEDAALAVEYSAQLASGDRIRIAPGWSDEPIDETALAAIVAASGRLFDAVDSAVQLRFEQGGLAVATDDEADAGPHAALTATLLDLLGETGPGLALDWVTIDGADWPLPGS